MFKRFIAGFINYNKQLSLEKQITTRVILMLSVTSILSGSLNVVLGFPKWYSVLLYFESVIGFSIIFTSYIKRDETFLKLLFVSTLYLIAFISWPYNAGIDGPDSLYLFAILILCMGVFDRGTIAHFVFNFTFFSFLVLMSYWHPDFISVNYGSEEKRIADMLITYLILGVTVITVIMTVIRSYKGARETAAQNELKFRTLFSMSPDPVFIVEKNTGKIIDINEKVLKFYGYERDELIGKLNTSVSAEPEATSEKTNHPERYIPLRYHKRKNGDIFPVEITAEIISISKTEIIIASIRDISERVRIEEERRRALILLQENEARYKQSNADKNRFFSILSHDLRGPFSSLLGLSDMLLRNLDKYDLNNIRTNVTYISEISHNTYNLLEDLLLWSGSQSGNLKYEPVRIRLSELFSGIVRTMSPSAGNKKIALKFSAGENDYISGDIDMLNTVLRNLVSNSIKFTNEGGEILLSSQLQDGEILISVSDNGIGIPEKDQAKLWNITTTYSARGTHGETGTGMGLILCKDFIEKHGGKIWVESKAGIGSTFKITLPACSIS